MKKAVITIATVFALVVSAETSMAAPQHGHSEPAVITSSTEQRNGADFALGDVAGGQMFGGLEFGISHQSTTLRSNLISANISTHAYDATLSALWVAGSQLYVEGQFRYSAFDSDIRLNARDTVEVGASGYDVSAEIGKPFTLSNELTLIPQLQAVYSDIDLDDIADPVGAGRVGALAGGETLTARLGLRAELALEPNALLYGQIDIYHAFGSETATRLAQNIVLNGQHQNTAGLTVGGAITLSDNAVLYGEITGETGLGSRVDSHSFGWNIGLEYQF